MNIYDVINGTVKDSDSGIWYQSEKKLDIQEILIIAKAAKQSHYFDRYVQWLEFALFMAKSQNMRMRLERLIKKAKSDHDKAFQTSLV